MSDAGWARTPGSARSVARATHFGVLKDGERPSPDATLLAAKMRAVPNGDWLELFRLAHFATDLPVGTDRRYTLSMYARIVQAWRPECREGSSHLRAWVDHSDIW